MSVAIKYADTDELVEGCRLNNRRAQEQLYRNHYRFAMTIALRYSRDEADAADIISHGFVKIFKNIHTYDKQKGSLEAWISRIIINEGLDHIKSRERFSHDMELETVEEPEIPNTVLERMGADEIMKIIHKLPPITHAVFVLYAVEGYKHREIARRLQLTEGNSRWHLSEARKFLQTKLKAIQP